MTSARRWAALFLCAAVAGGAPAAALAQRAQGGAGCCAAAAVAARARVAADSVRVAPAPSPRALFASRADGRTAGGITAEEARRRARWAPLASAALPGAGQALLDQQRFIPYLALEGYALLQLLADSREGARQRSAYRKLASTVARSPLSSSTPNGSWEYYERMEHFVESGAYDVQPGGALDPEPDTATYNGSVWLLARQTYWVDPGAAPPPGSAAYESALSFYRQRAVTPQYVWSWRNAELEQDVFRRTIARSNDAYRRAAQDLAVVIANHVLSTVDAYVTVRLRGRRLAGDARSRTGVPAGAYGVVVALPLPRAGTAAGR